MREDAAQIRATYINKPFPKGNIAVAEVHIQGDVIFCVGGTSRSKSPTPKPKPKCEGGQFEPTIDPYSGHLMDTDAEYKVLSAIADILEMFYDIQVRGDLYLYTERNPCTSCNDVLRQFKEKFPNIRLEVFWDHPYPPI